MKRILFVLTASLFLAACGNSSTETTNTNETAAVETFGEGLSEASVVSIGQLKSKLQESMEASADETVEVEAVAAEGEEVEEKKIFAEAKLTGKVKKVCKKQGCWMKVKTPEGEEIMVTFKDYSFKVPKDCEGRKTTFEGVAYYEIVSVDELRHLAEDEGKSKEEIAKITEPKKELRFEAKAVELKKL